MKVALIAQDSKKKLMQNLCVAYRSILIKHDLYATGTTGRLIEEASGLNVHKSLAGQIGGEEQIGAMIDQNQIDLVIFFRDPSGPRSRELDVNKVMRLCDIHNVPLATNIGTAELLLKSLDRGDLDWREMYR
jgi:methylglyoxal synthase